MDRRQRGGAAARGQGAARARQMGLLIDFSPDGMMGGAEEEDDDDADLEAELLALTGAKPAGGREKPKGKVPLPMEHIERMAAMCMKDLDEEDGEDDDEDLENDDDLMAELDDVLGEDDAPEPSKPPAAAAAQLSSAPAASGSPESMVAERLDMYKTAIANAKQAGESSKVRRYERGMKTLEGMLVSVRNGKTINEEHLPPPVAVGKSSGAEEVCKSSLLSERNDVPSQQVNSSAEPPSSANVPPAIFPKAKPLPPVPAKGPQSSKETPTQVGPRLPATSSGLQDSGVKASVLERQREYKLAALQAKQQGDVELAKSIFY